MKTGSLRGLAPLVVFAALALAACNRGGDAGGSLKIAVIPKGTTHDFWKSIHAGAVKAAKELGGVEIVWRGPEREDDRDQQISLVQNFVSGGASGIVLAPLDHRALLAPVQLAMQSKIPVVVIDSGLDGAVGRDFVSYVATDNEKGGRLAGARMVDRLEGKGRVLMLRYAEGSESTTQREKGFVDALASSADIQLVDPKRYAGATRATAQEASENLLAANADFDGVFCPNESSTFGMLLALRSHGLAGKRKFVGFDASPGLVEALRAGELDGLVLQNPMNMGEQGVRAVVAHLRGKPVEARVDTGVALVTRATMDEPAMRELLAPDLAQWLGR